MIPAPCADKRIGDPVEGASLADCRKICEGDKDCAFQTHVAAKEGKSAKEVVEIKTRANSSFLLLIRVS